MILQTQAVFYLYISAEVIHHSTALMLKLLMILFLTVESLATFQTLVEGFDEGAESPRTVSGSSVREGDDGIQYTAFCIETFSN